MVRLPAPLCSGPRGPRGPRLTGALSGERLRSALRARRLRRALRGRRLRRVGPYLVSTLIAAGALIGLAIRPPAAAPMPHADYVLIAGAAGLRWDDINPTDTPTMWRLAQQGSIGALSVRSAHTPTCTADGWLTLGAGNLARTEQRADEPCARMDVAVRSPDGIGGNLGDVQRRVVETNQALPYGTQPGALAEAVRCTAAIGPGATLAAARPFGRVDRYAATLPKDAKRLLATCVLSIVDLGTVTGSDPAGRRASVRAADAMLARAFAARPDNSLVMVAGLADTEATSRLHVAIADGPGFHRGWLTSSSTSRPGYVQLIDLAPTALDALDKPLPAKLFAGQAATSLSGRPAGLSAAVAALADADREAAAQHDVVNDYYLGLTLAELLLFALAVPLLRRARRHAGPHDPRPAPAALVRVEETLLVAAALSLPAALLADAVPWWRAHPPGLFFVAVSLAITAALTALVAAGRWCRGAVPPLGVVGGIAAVVVGIDVLTGSWLQLNGVAGYSALASGRYAGVGPVGLGLLVAGVLLVAGWLAQRSPRPWRPAVVSVAGGVGVILVGSPYLGADAAGAVALAAGACVAAALCTGGWLTIPRLASATLAGVVVTVGFALLDLRRPGSDWGSLGSVLAEAHNGTASEVAHRLVAVNADSLLDSPLSLLVLGGAALVTFALIRPWGGLKRLFGLYPAVRAALVGGGTAALLAGVLDGTALDVAGAATALGVPLATLGALRVLDHADDRTVAAALHPPDAWPDAGCSTGALPPGDTVSPACAVHPPGAHAAAPTGTCGR
jgi:hypothetical protein